MLYPRFDPGILWKISLERSIEILSLFGCLVLASVKKKNYLSLPGTVSSQEFVAGEVQTTNQLSIKHI